MISDLSVLGDMARSRKDILRREALIEQKPQSHKTEDYNPERDPLVLGLRK